MDGPPALSGVPHKRKKLFFRVFLTFATTCDDLYLTSSFLSNTHIRWLLCIYKLKRKTHLSSCESLIRMETKFTSQELVNNITCKLLKIATKYRRQKKITSKILHSRDLDKTKKATLATSIKNYKHNKLNVY